MKLPLLASPRTICVSLHSLPRRFFFGLAVAVCAGLFLDPVVRSVLTWAVLRNPDLTAFQTATRWEPSNAAHWGTMGSIVLLEGKNVDEATRLLLVGIKVNPHDSRLWLDLANTYFVRGDSVRQQEALDRALSTDPANTNVAWEAANFYMVQGSLERALPLYRTVIDGDRALRRRALEICWRVTSDSVRIVNQVLPLQVEAYRDFLAVLVERKELSEARYVWKKLTELRQPLRAEELGFYVDFLLSERDIKGAKEAWALLTTMEGSNGVHERSNLVFNGGFENAILNVGFDWRYEPRVGIQARTETLESHSGRSVLVIGFDGSAAEAGIFQFVPLEPHQEYSFRAYVKTGPYDGASGPRLAIIDAYSGSILLLSDDLRGPDVWREYSSTFKTGDKTELALLQIVRAPADPRLRGKLWLDDLQLIAK